VKFKTLTDYFEQNGILTPTEVDFLISGQVVPANSVTPGKEPKNGNTPPVDIKDVLVYAPGGLIVRARTPNQKKLVTASEKNDIVFAIGPAGTGKTYTAVALAVRALKNREIRRIILTRPAVEAGENLGFLPGDLKEKIDPYLRPLYDALFDMVPGEKLRAFIESGVIEVAPLAFMRGRTLDNAFVILDEAQNATESQLKMFLTRMGPSAKFIVTGDTTQVDLPRNQPSGLIQATRLLKGIEGIEFVNLDASDVVRHRLVREIIGAYQKVGEDKEKKS
jgi:phosphate starvation-inducible PhoH-like protein